MKVLSINCGSSMLKFYRDPDRFIDVMHNSIAINGSFFNTHRMMQEYVLKAYFR
jgi:starch phosphorylase